MAGSGNFVTTPASSAPAVTQPSLYLTVDQFFQRHDRRIMSELSNDNGNRIPVENTIQQLIYDAESELEMTLNGRYPLPPGVIPPAYKRFVAARVAWALYSRRTQRPTGIDKENEWADKFLSDLQNGIIIPTGATPQGVTVSQDFTSATFLVSPYWGPGSTP